MRLDKAINEIFSSDEVEKKDAYKDNKERQKRMPEKWAPMIIKNELNDFGVDGVLKKRKKKQ